MDKNRKLPLPSAIQIQHVFFVFKLCCYFILMTFINTKKLIMSVSFVDNNNIGPKFMYSSLTPL